ncbi:MAG TPA: hypothetical protein H9774_13505 [Candidatus Desulfovibrio gallistercoris]|nr:hypothetical protein [Candidatus Desulfovibrio gallistercoris]
MIYRGLFHDIAFMGIALANEPVLKRIVHRKNARIFCLHNALVFFQDLVDMLVVFWLYDVHIFGGNPLLQKDRLKHALGSQSVMMIRVGPATFFQQQVRIAGMAGEDIIKIGTHACIPITMGGK